MQRDSEITLHEDCCIYCLGLGTDLHCIIVIFTSLTEAFLHCSGNGAFVSCLSYQLLPAGLGMFVPCRFASQTAVLLRLLLSNKLFEVLLNVFLFFVFFFFIGLHAPP